MRDELHLRPGDELDLETAGEENYGDHEHHAASLKLFLFEEIRRARFQPDVVTSTAMNAVAATKVLVEGSSNVE